MSFNTRIAITLNLLKCFRHFAQAAARIACAVVSVMGILFISAANAVAPIHDGIQIQQTPKQYAKANLPLHEYKFYDFDGNLLDTKQYQNVYSNGGGPMTDCNYVYQSYYTITPKINNGG